MRVHSKSLLLVTLLGASLVAMAPAQTAKPSKPKKPAKAVEPAPPPIDRAALVEQVRAAELAFAKTVADDDIEAFGKFIDPEAVFISGMTVTRGVVAVLESWKGSFGPGAPYFEWHPEVIELSPDATFALSRGPWTIRTTDKRGRVKETKGVFNTIWRRHADGSWKVLYDAGCPPCPDCR
jgi:ketosteroid isomerase-like protein